MVERCDNERKKKERGSRREKKKEKNHSNGVSGFETILYNVSRIFKKFQF